ncbi:MAG TPA: VWA domain-containing protein [Bryobacteraceae bacterium]|nr:VWA domain-containing protein [Bryobacteraceae bacterium]
MTCRWWARTGWRAAAVLSLAVAGEAQQQPTFRTNVNLVRVVATVKTQAGELVGALRKEDFAVADNTVAQEVAVFERQTDQPLSVALMVDTSGSTAKDLKYETESATRFLRALLGEGNAQDSVALYTFNWQVRRENYFTHNLTSLTNSLKLLHGEAGTSLYDAIFLASRDLEDREGRKVMIIVTDGGDTTSSKDVHQALRSAQFADAVIYPVVVIPITNDAGRNIGGENALKFMADGTGGRTFLPSLGAELDRAFSDIIDELRTQYILGFYPRNVPLTKDRFHKLQVTVQRPELRVSARNGYYGEAEGETGTPDARISVTPDRKTKKKQEK